MAPEQIEAERVVFEAWAKIEGKNRGCGWKLPQFLRTDSGHYVAGWTAALWDGWLTRAELAHAERREMQETEQRLRAEIARLQAIADRAVPDGWKLVAVNAGFDDLIYCLDRCYSKGHLENCSDLIEPWEAFDYQLVASAPQPQDSTP